jgi:hypothetical protein
MQIINYMTQRLVLLFGVKNQLSSIRMSFRACLFGLFVAGCAGKAAVQKKLLL